TADGSAWSTARPCGGGVHVGGDRRHVGAREMDGHHSDEAGDVGRAQRGDREVAAACAAVMSGERVTACARGGEDCPAALLKRWVSLLVLAAAAEEEGEGRCSRERAQVFSACGRCGRASSVRAAAKR